MAFDILIKNGTVVDGSGMPKLHADVAIKDGKIAEVGTVDEPAARVIDADGLVVAPGIVDPHTHYDAQLTWDPIGSSSCFHGVTSVIAGNCGYTVAPCRPGDRDWLAKTFAAVEGVDLEALQAGLPWTWETYPEYLDTLDRRLGINFTGYVGHSAIRRYVLGEESNQRSATLPEIEAMKEIVRGAMQAGAAGFSTSLSPTQVGYYNEPIPSRLATDEEVLALAKVVAEFNTGNIAVLPRSILQGINEEDRAMLVRLAKETGRPLVVQGNILSDLSASEGVGLFGFQNARPMDRPFTLKHTSIFNGLPTWRTVLGLPHAEKVAQLQDETVREGLRYEVEHGNTDPSKGLILPPIPWHTIYVMNVQRAENQPYLGKSLTQLAEIQGKHIADAFADLALSENLDTQFRYLQEWSVADEAKVRGNLANPYALVGTSDGGAHLDRDDGAEYSTFFLRYWVHDRQAFTLEDAIRRLTFVPASVVGLVDRGLLRPGYAADLMIIDPDNIRLTGKALIEDLPGGGSRFSAGCTGVHATLVNGEVLIEDGRHTGALPGRVLRCYRSNLAPV